MLVYEGGCLYLRLQTGVNEPVRFQSKQPTASASRGDGRAGGPMPPSAARQALRGGLDGSIRPAAFGAQHLPVTNSSPVQCLRWEMPRSRWLTGLVTTRAEGGAAAGLPSRVGRGRGPSATLKD
ncbi:hypothetical protein A176_003235 [Myxococcus hansupus]|uniref:Uncharacterized protein n=1 Tax=Pseudomyxococcus hansupus TaxID=1297742 RepID=A0A0H4WXH0_9BACT|nr:hypothetical protein A176_003235 [Myxococcus hansupus]